MAPVERAASLPPASFTSPEWFDTERELFHASWVAVARSAELSEPNSFVTADIAGEPVVVVRGRDDRLRALSNVCPHRSTTIMGEQSGSAPSLQCGYHLWTFNHDGQLRAAPDMDQVDGFDPGSVCLSSFAVEEFHGFVLVNIDGDATPIIEAAPGLDALLTEHRVGDMVSVGSFACPSPWNWKIIVENFLESYHHRGVHTETLEPRYPGSKSFVPSTGDEPWCLLDHVSVEVDHEPFMVFALYPSTLVAINRGFGAFWFRPEPRSVDHTHLTISAHLLPEIADTPGIGEATLEGLMAINDEDAAINARTAAGMRSKFARPGRISHLEAAAWHFRRWLVQRMSEVVEQS